MRSVLPMVRGRVSAFLGKSTGPASLATLRIVTFANILLFLPRGSDIEGFADLPKALRSPPTGLGLVAPNLPITRPLVHWCSRALVAAAAMATAGMFTTGAATAVVVLGTYVGAVPWYYTHHGHKQHLIWMAALLAASPCADALSVDQLIRRHRLGRVSWLPSRAYGRPIALAWLLLGSMYLVPGVGKIASTGPAWAFSDNLRNRLWQEWYADGAAPSPAVQRFVARRPGLLRLAALSTIVWETGFIFAIFSRRGRRLASAASVMFHVGVRLVTRIDFLSLATVHIGLIEWSGLGKQMTSQSLGVSCVRTPNSMPAIVTGTIIVANHLMLLTRNAYGWPFSIYPVFRGVAKPTTTELHVELRRAGQDPQPLDLKGAFRAHQIPPAVACFLEGMTLEASEPAARDRFEALWKLVRGDFRLDDASEVVFCSDLVSVDPARARSRLLERRLVYRFRERDLQSVIVGHPEHVGSQSPLESGPQGA
jgi:hypothetical protein